MTVGVVDQDVDFFYHGTVNLVAHDLCRVCHEDKTTAYTCCAIYLNFYERDN